MGSLLLVIEDAPGAALRLSDCEGLRPPWLGRLAPIDGAAPTLDRRCARPVVGENEGSVLVASRPREGVPCTTRGSNEDAAGLAPLTLPTKAER
jgi:hypothetical protein